MQKDVSALNTNISPPDVTVLTRPRRVSANTLIKFGQQAVSGKNGVFFTVEYQLPGALNGGLGIVSDYIPRSLNQHQGKEVRVVMPATAPLADHIFNKAGQTTHGWEDTQESIILEVPWKNQPGYSGSSTLTFRIYQNYLKDRKTWLYALVSWDKVLQEMDKSKPDGTVIRKGHYQSVSGMKKFYEAYGQRLDHGGVQLALLCNKAMAQAAQRLDPTKYTKPEHSKLQQADAQIDFWITNDWMTGHIANLPEATQDIGQVFIVHNLYDKDLAPPVQHTQTAKIGFFDKLRRNFVTLLKRIANILSLGWLGRKYKWNFNKSSPQATPTTFDFQKAYGLKGTTSLLNASLKGADTVVVNEEFLKTMRDTELLPLRNQQAVQDTLNQIEPKRFFDMHHGAVPEYEPVNNPVLSEKTRVALKLLDAKGWDALGKAETTQLPVLKTVDNHHQVYGFSALPEGLIPTMPRKQPPPSRTQLVQLKQWKQKNKLALQKLLGLRQDPHAILYCWTNRLDPYQKLVHPVFEEMRAFLKREPHAQFVIWQVYDGSDPHINKALQDLQAEFPDRFLHAHFDSNGQILLNAGSDYSLLPSMYEPYGIALLQASQLGCLPIASDVDGLHSTVSDPERNSGRVVPVWEYGQTGLLIPHINPARIQKLHAEMNGNPKASLSEAAQEIKAQLQASIREALDRSIQLARQDDAYFAAVYNGMRFIKVEHDWKALSSRYHAPINKAFSLAKARSLNVPPVKRASS